MTATDDVPARHAAMIGAAARLRNTRASEFPIERLLFTLGTICLPAGIIAIIVGWYGVAHTGFVFQQNSYLISGGMLGLGLIFIGGFLYFAYWMTRQIRATETGNQQTLRALSRVEAQLSAIAAATGGPRQAGAPVGESTLVATARGSLVHRPGCSVLAGKSNLRKIDRDTPGLRPCQVCFPFDGT